MNGFQSSHFTHFTIFLRNVTILGVSEIKQSYCKNIKYNVAMFCPNFFILWMKDLLVINKQLTLKILSTFRSIQEIHIKSQNTIKQTFLISQYKFYYFFNLHALRHCKSNALLNEACLDRIHLEKYENICRNYCQCCKLCNKITKSNNALHSSYNFNIL